MQFNTAIAAIMEHLNNVYLVTELEELNETELAIYAESCAVIPQLLYPFAPHIAEELWLLSGNKKLLHLSGVPEYNSDYLVKDQIVIRGSDHG